MRQIIGVLKNFFLFLISCFFFLPTLVSSAEHEHISKTQLKLAGPPWQPFLSEINPQKGIATEIVVEALRRANYQTQVRILPWRRVLAESKNGTVDVLIGLWHTAEREEDYTFSSAYYLNEINFLVAGESSINAYRGLDSLRENTIGVRTGASYGSEFDSANYLNKVFVPSSSSMLQMLAIGRIDLGIGDKLILSKLIQENELLKKQLRFIEPAAVKLPLRMAVVNARSDRSDIVAGFNQALADMIQDGSLGSIYRRNGVTADQSVIQDLMRVK